MGNPMTELQGVACYMGSHSVTCHLTQANATTHPALTPASEGWYSIYLPQRDGRLRWPRCPDDAPSRSRTTTARSEVQRHNRCYTKTPAWHEVLFQSGCLSQFGIVPKSNSMYFISGILDWSLPSFYVGKYD